jgi:LmbE family N-acetylglucosaminyl deacetylase
LSGSRVAVVVAHPDDETIGFAAHLRRWRPTIVLLTDGAPRDPWFARQVGFAERVSYARARGLELARALALVGVPADRVHRLDVPDQEAIQHLGLLTEHVLRLAAGCQLIATHCYEGGHPDHDAAAVVVHAAAKASRPRPTILEASFYHDAFGETRYGEFIPIAGAGPPETLVLSRAERVQKRGMLECYVSQQEVLRRFKVDVERVRIAPSYDFQSPPHQGQLHYERWRWPVTGTLFRAQVAAAGIL